MSAATCTTENNLILIDTITIITTHLGSFFLDGRLLLSLPVAVGCRSILMFTSAHGCLIVVSVCPACWYQQHQQHHASLIKCCVVAVDIFSTVLYSTVQ